MGKFVRRTGARRSRLCSDHGRIGVALELRVQASFSQFELAKFEGSLFHFHLARKLRFHIFHFQILKEVSHESFIFTSSAFTFCCFVFDVVNFDNWGSLAELLRRRQVQNLGRPRRISAFLMLSSSIMEEVSQNSFVFKLVDRQMTFFCLGKASSPSKKPYARLLHPLILIYWLVQNELPFFVVRIPVAHPP